MRRLLSDRVVDAFYPLHDKHTLNDILAHWVRQAYRDQGGRVTSLCHSLLDAHSNGSLSAFACRVFGGSDLLVDLLPLEPLDCPVRALTPPRPKMCIKIQERLFFDDCIK
jgi:hypothetical protein